MSEPYEREGRVVIPDPYVSQFGTETPGGYDEGDGERCPICAAGDDCPYSE